MSATNYNTNDPEAGEMNARMLRIVKFLRGLDKLSKECGIKIGGCGCCASPYLRDITEEEAANTYVVDNEESRDTFGDLQFQSEEDFRHRISAMDNMEIALRADGMFRGKINPEEEENDE